MSKCIKISAHPREDDTYIAPRHAVHARARRRSSCVNVAFHRIGARARGPTILRSHATPPCAPTAAPPLASASQVCDQYTPRPTPTHKYTISPQLKVKPTPARTLTSLPCSSELHTGPIAPIPSTDARRGRGANHLCQVHRC